MPQNDSVSQQLVDRLPATLDTIITRNRDIARLSLASEPQLAALTKTIPMVGDNELRGAVSDWRFIAYQVTVPNEPPLTHIHLLGDDAASGEGTKITSAIVGLDLGTRIVATHSGSFYRLIGSGGRGEPNFHQLLQVCGAFWQWGRGDALGVLHVFY